MVLSDSVSGVSRSGRVRKKSAKLMEMDDDHMPPGFGGGGSGVPGMGNSGSGGLLDYGTVGTLDIGVPGTSNRAGVSASSGRKASYKGTHQKASPVSPPTGGPFAPTSLFGIAPTTASTTSSRQRLKSTPVSPNARGSTSIGSSVVKVPSSSSPLHKVSIKQLDSPGGTSSFEGLTGGSAYLMGDDIHFITGEAVDDDDDDTGHLDDDDDDGGVGRRGHMSPLKIDVGSVGGVGDDHCVSLNEESGLKMKFILSPKSSKIDSLGRGSSSKKKKKKKKSSSVEGTSSRRKSSGKSNGSRSKAKKSRASAVEGLLALDMLASGGMAGAASSQLMESTMSEDDDDDEMEESKLIIAEPLPLPTSSSSSSRSKKKSGGGHNTSSRSGGSKSKKKSSSSKSPGAEATSMSSPEASAMPFIPDVSSQQKSVYLKEKSSKKKATAKKSSKPKEKTEKKQRTVSAYMVWSKESRKEVVSEFPGLNFASISRKMGEKWQAMPEKEKLHWRRKAKNLSCKNNNSNLINTGGGGGGGGSSKMVEKREKGGRVVSSGGGRHLASKADESSLAFPSASKDTVGHRPVGTTPLDVAAHLKLLGESLSIIGQRLTEHEGQIAVSGSLSVLLDSTLCALGPLLCLTSEVRQLDGCPKEVQESVLDNIAYIMPGL